MQTGETFFEKFLFSELTSCFLTVSYVPIKLPTEKQITDFKNYILFTIYPEKLLT